MIFSTVPGRVVLGLSFDSAESCPILLTSRSPFLEQTLYTIELREKLQHQAPTCGRFASQGLHREKLGYARRRLNNKENTPRNRDSLPRCLSLRLSEVLKDR